MNLNIQQNKDYSPIYLPKGTTNLNINENGLFDSIHLDEPRVIIQTDDYLELIQQDELELFDVCFKFSDDIWDFSCKAEEFKKKSTYQYRFNSIFSDEHKTLCKLFVLNSLLENGLHRPYIYFCLLENVSFLNYLHKNCIQIENLSSEELGKYFEKQNVSISTKSHLKNYINKMVEFYCIVTDKSVDYDVLSYLENLETHKVKTQLIENKTKLLPHSIMKPLVTLFYDEFKNKTLNIKYRRCLALLYIDTQSGIRPGELLMLSNDCIVKQNALGKTLYQLKYKSTKGVRGKGYKIYNTLANEKVEEAVNFLKENVKDNGPLGQGLNTTDLSDSLKKLITSHIEMFNEEELNEYGYNGYPKTYQFRVYFASELKRRGYNDMIVSKMLGHEDEKMWGYYGRPVDTIQEDWEYSKQIVENVRHEDLKIMGAKGNIYEKKIKRFLNSNDIKVEVSEEKIIEEILEKYPIRQKCGGFCIKPNSSRPCEMNNEEESDNILCAYDICPNQCHVYYDCAYYLNIFEQQKKVIKANMEGNFKNAAQKELYKTQRILEDRIVPEIEELENQILKQGIDKILINHPYLKNIISNLDNIKGEVKEWLSKKI